SVRMTRQLLLSAFFGTLLFSSVHGANILGIFTCFSPSHLIIEISMAKVLAEHGHNVTVVTTLKPHVSHENLNIIHIVLSEEDIQNWKNSIADMAKVDNTNMITALFRLREQMAFMFSKNVEVMYDPRVKDLYENKDNKFDLVMIGYFMNNFQMGIAHKLRVPVVIASSMFQWEIFDNMLGNPRGLSYIPTVDLQIERGRPLNFRERLYNLISAGFQRIFTYQIDRDNAQAYNDLYGDDPAMPEYEELNRNVSLIFFNSHALSEGPIRPNLPGAIEVGGIQIKEKPDPLPQDMADFINNSTDGTILLSLGSNMRGSFIKPDTIQKMFNVLSKLKQRVIWKWEDLDKTPGKSDNILYSAWVPQDDILAHPKVILFINHAGRGGITESQYHGKPMLSLPIFGDQPGNAQKMVFDGFGRSMSLLTLEEQPFRENILEVLNNPDYTQRVRAFSALFRDRPLSARQTVLYWTEYVLRYHGAPHLQSPILRMSFVAANNLDVYALLAVVLVVVAFTNYLVFALIYRKCRGSSKKTIKKD
ncbi:hypothetical protein KR222_003850, partial [Zaprionus bogoriensis]